MLLKLLFSQTNFLLMYKTNPVFQKQIHILVILLFDAPQKCDILRQNVK